eukprot:scaffold500909_cov43-Prasinocladus_malaysianus.AAC.1
MYNYISKRNYAVECTSCRFGRPRLCGLTAHLLWTCNTGGSARHALAFSSISRVQSAEAFVRLRASFLRGWQPRQSIFATFAAPRGHSSARLHRLKSYGAVTHPGAACHPWPVRVRTDRAGN